MEISDFQGVWEQARNYRMRWQQRNSKFKIQNKLKTPNQKFKTEIKDSSQIP